MQSGSSRNKDITLSAKVFLHLCPPRPTRLFLVEPLLHVCVSLVGFSRCKFANKKLWLVNSFLLHLTRMSNSDSNKVEINEWPLTQRIYAPGVIGVMFHFPVTSLWQDCRLCGFLSVPEKKHSALWAICLPRCFAGSKSGLSAWGWLIVKTDAKFLSGLLCPNPYAVFVDVRDDWCAMVLTLFAHFTVALPTLHRWATDRAICAKQQVPWEGVAAGTCLREDVHWVHCMSRYAATTTPEKERLCVVWSSLIVTGEGGRYFGHFYLKTTRCWFCHILLPVKDDASGYN